MSVCGCQRIRGRTKIHAPLIEHRNMSRSGCRGGRERVDDYATAGMVVGGLGGNGGHADVSGERTKRKPFRVKRSQIKRSAPPAQKNRPRKNMQPLLGGKILAIKWSTLLFKKKERHTYQKKVVPGRDRFFVGEKIPGSIFSGEFT